jgi:alkaline phosphatase
MVFKRMGLLCLTWCGFGAAWAAPAISRLTPPSEWFANQRSQPMVARFLPDQRFDLQATVRPDAPEQQITQVSFSIDGQAVVLPVALKSCSQGCLKNVPSTAVVATVRGVSVQATGVHELEVRAVQSDGQTASAKGHFEIVAMLSGHRKIKNVIFMLGDGMGVAQRTAARIVSQGYAQGKSLAPLAMDTLPVTGLVKTASLNSIVTDSSPGMSSYVTGNKHNNNEEGVFPDDTTDPFDNPRIEYLSEYLHRTQGKALGIVTTADVFDATPAAIAVHTGNRGAGTGIVDQFLDDRHLSGLSVLMGGGRRWFLPSGTAGSSRSASNDYAFSDQDPHTHEIVQRWRTAAGRIDPQRDLIADFKAAGFAYAGNKTEMDALGTNTRQLLSLFALSNMNVALDKINGRRSDSGSPAVVKDFGLPDQPMLDEMTRKALQVMQHHDQGFVLLIEGASIDKQAHGMDTERWILDTIEFDRAVKVARDFAQSRGDTLLIVTADHETAGVSILGASRLTDQSLQDTLRQAAQSSNADEAHLRNPIVGLYERAGFPTYHTAEDGYPITTDIDRRLLIGYGADADRMEDWRTNPLPLNDRQQPLANQPPLSAYPSNPKQRDLQTGFKVLGQIPGDAASHTGTDVPLSAFGPGALAFTGVMDNTDVFFLIGQMVTAGVPSMDDLMNRRYK